MSSELQSAARSSKRKGSSGKSAPGSSKGKGPGSKSDAEMSTPVEAHPEQPPSLPEQGRARAVIEAVQPQIDGGRYRIKRIVGDEVLVQADIFTDGHDRVAARLRHRPEHAPDWSYAPMIPGDNDHWSGGFDVQEPGRHLYQIEAWADRFLSWRHDLQKRVDAQTVTEVDLQIGSQILQDAKSRARKEDAARLGIWIAALRSSTELSQRAQEGLSPELAAVMERCPDLSFVARSPLLEIEVNRPRARFSAWYEFFPRSTGPDPETHGTFRHAESRLSYIAQMGFDIVYLPPIHPIGETFRKGKNNSLTCQPGEPGSPWAIGAKEGGHKAIHPTLGNLDDFRSFVAETHSYGMEVALDIAFQCSPDHPYVREHPDWFRKRPDGTIQYAENPPKKYQDIYPFDFESSDWQALWIELRSIFLFWIGHGVRVFRVDNPHTKSFAFWQWCIDSIKREHPEVIFLSEAFTRPKLMKNLAKLGFQQSYTYFAWRYSKQEFVDYLTELTQTECAEFMRPNFWPNTPDILTDQLQKGGRSMFVIRYLLAATLAPSYGIYGPAFELCEARSVREGSEEYRDSEKYQCRSWDLEDPQSIRDIIALVNWIRRENRAFQSDHGLQFLPVDNDQLLAFLKYPPGRIDEAVLVIISLDPHWSQSGFLEVPLESLQIPDGQPFTVHELLTDARYSWHGRKNFVRLDPNVVPGHIFRIVRS